MYRGSKITNLNATTLKTAKFLSGFAANKKFSYYKSNQYALVSDKNYMHELQNQMKQNPYDIISKLPFGTVILLLQTTSQL